MKKLLSVILSITILFSVVSTVSFSAEAASVGKTNNLTVTGKGSTYVNLKWKKVKKATGYQVYCSTAKSKGFKLVKKIGKGKTVTAKVTSLKPNKKYYFKVRAVKKKKKGKFSKTVSTATSKTAYQIPVCDLINLIDEDKVIYYGDKVGDYYIYNEFEETYDNENPDNNRSESAICVSSSSKTEGKPIVKRVYENGVFHFINSYISNGANIIYSVNNYDYKNLSDSDVYSVSINGNNNKKLFSQDGGINLVSFYGKTIYYCNSNNSLQAYNISDNKTKTIIKNVFPVYSEGRYILFTKNIDEYSTNGKLYILDVVKNKTVKISDSFKSACFVDGDIYFTKLAYKKKNSQIHKYNIYRCSLNGKNKKQIGSTKWIKYFCDDDEDYIIMAKKGLYYDDADSETIYFYNFKTKKTSVFFRN